jgi:uncharacterized protein YqeY
MSLKEKINADYMSAFKSKNVVAKNLLSVVKGEIQTIEKNIGAGLAGGNWSVIKDMIKEGFTDCKVTVVKYRKR